MFEVPATLGIDRLGRGGPLGALRRLGQLGPVWVATVVTVHETWPVVDAEFRDVLTALAGWLAPWEIARKSERSGRLHRSRQPRCNAASDLAGGRCKPRAGASISGLLGRVG
ncbi:MAG: hypothetical protein ACRENX_05790 [Candidatus Dormibacteria bacterium]